MRRRRYLAAWTVIGGALAGCTGDDSGTTETEAAAAQTAYEDAFREALAREDVEVRELAYDDGRVRLGYRPAEPSEAGVEESIEVAARAYFDRVYGGWNAARLDASVYVDGLLVATWHMETAWIDAYLDGEITREELGERVEDSVERYDDGNDGKVGDDGDDGDDDDDGNDSGTGSPDGTAGDDGE